MYCDQAQIEGISELKTEQSIDSSADLKSHEQQVCRCLKQNSQELKKL